MHCLRPLQIPVQRYKKQHGVSLIELMISLTIGLFISLAIGAVFMSSSRSEQEVSKSQQKMANANYAIDALGKDLWHAGYYGRFPAPLADLTSEPDPCNVDLTAMATSLSLPVQIFWASDFDTAADMDDTTCDLPDQVAGSDVVVVKRANTWPLNATAVNTATEVNAVYMGTSLGSLNLILGATGLNANSTAFTNAEPYRLIQRIYYVAACANPTGTDGECQAGDDGGQNVPSLRMVEMVPGVSGPEFRNVTVAEGIEAIRVEIGADNQPVAVNELTGSIGDGSADIIFPSLAEREAGVTDGYLQSVNTVMAKIYVLARNSRASPGYTDAKSYALGAETKAAANDGFSRNVYEQAVRIANIAGRRQN